MKVIGGKIVKFCADIVKTFTGASASAAGKKGLVPAPAAGRNTYYLRGDGTWQAPVNDNTTTAAGRVMDARQANPNISGTIAANVKSLNDSFNATKNYVRELSLTGTSLNIPADGKAYLHIPVPFIYAIVMCRMVTYNNQARFFTVICYTNHARTNEILVLHKEANVGNINLTIGSDTGVPVIVVEMPGLASTTLRSCDMTLLIRGMIL
jgi:hypothetical protein